MTYRTPSIASLLNDTWHHQSSALGLFDKRRYKVKGKILLSRKKLVGKRHVIVQGCMPTGVTSGDVTLIQACLVCLGAKVATLV